MVDSDFIPPLTNLGDQGDLRAALIRRVPYTFTATDNPEDFTAVDAGTGSIPWALVWAGHIFYFDPNDTTTAHDGITTLVTLDGYRYKIDTVAGERISVISRFVSAPPTSPSLNDSFLIPSGASGAWATKPSNIAVWTARGWAYIPPQVGQLVFVRAEGGYYHYTNGGTWTAGLGVSALGNGSVRASSLIGGRTHWVIVNQTTNTPPGSPANGVAYIVGPAPTGAWSGQSGRIAAWEINAWAFYVPQEGWTAYDQALNSNFIYNISWVQQASGYDQVLESAADASVTISVGGSGGYSYSATSPPSRNNNGYFDPLSLSVQAAYPGQAFEVSFIASQDSITATVFVVGLFVDSETNARDWQRVSGPGIVASFRMTLGDIGNHTLTIRTFANASTATSRRRIISRRRS